MVLGALLVWSARDAAPDAGKDPREHTSERGS
jgi:hypothetical protein